MCPTNLVASLLRNVADLITLPCNREGRIIFNSLQIGRAFIRGDLMSLVMTIDQEATLSIQPVDRVGNPASVDGVPQWSSANGFAMLVPSDDGMSCVVRSNQAGTDQVSVKADADLGEGVKELVGMMDVEFLAGEAVSISISASNVVPRSDIEL